MQHSDKMNTQKIILFTLISLFIVNQTRTQVIINGTIIDKQSDVIYLGHFSLQAPRKDNLLQLKVYDILRKKVTTLVNEIQKL